jgi:hypothetical protein
MAFVQGLSLDPTNREIQKALQYIHSTFCLHFPKCIFSMQTQIALTDSFSFHYIVRQTMEQKTNDSEVTGANIAKALEVLSIAAFDSA